MLNWFLIVRILLKFEGQLLITKTRKVSSIYGSSIHYCLQLKKLFYSQLLKTVILVTDDEECVQEERLRMFDS